MDLEDQRNVPFRHAQNAEFFNARFELCGRILGGVRGCGCPQTAVGVVLVLLELLRLDQEVVEVLGGGGAGFLGTGFGRLEPLEFGKLVSYKRCFGWEDAQLRVFHHTCVRSRDCWVWTAFRISARLSRSPSVWNLSFR